MLRRMGGDSVTCGACGQVRASSLDICPSCASNELAIDVSDTLKPILREFVKMQGAPGEHAKVPDSKTRYEVRAGDVPSQRTNSGRAVIYRRLDRDGQKHDGVPWYEEIVIDPDTGERITNKSHPLADKFPSGSAKPDRK